MKKSMLSVLLVFVMLIGMVPTCVFASSRRTSDDYGSFIDGDKLINDIIETSGMNAHPRIIMSEEKFAALRAQEGKDTVTGILLEELRGEADNILKSRKNEPITYELDSEGHLLETSKKVQRGVATLALAPERICDRSSQQCTQYRSFHFGVTHKRKHCCLAAAAFVSLQRINI